MSKQTEWRGYYQPYLQRAGERGVDVLDLLDSDEEWSSSRNSVEKHVTPYLTPASTVLEIGCGIGRAGRFVAPACGYLVCTDVLPEALNAGHQRFREFANVSFVQTNGYDLAPFSDHSFDVVFSLTVFFHFDFELVLNYLMEVKRVLVPKGVGIVEFKQWKGPRDLSELLEKIAARGGIRTYEADIDKWRYVSVEMLQVVSDELGFEVLDTDMTHYTFRSKP